MCIRDSAVPAHQKRDEITPLSLAKDLGHARCVAIVDRAADGAPPAQRGAPPPRHPGLADGPYAPPPPPTTRAARLYGGGDVKALLTDAAAELGEGRACVVCREMTKVRFFFFRVFFRGFFSDANGARIRLGIRAGL